MAQAQGALSIKLRCASWQQLATIYKRDLSRGTMFLKAATPPAIGTPVRIDLTLPSASVIVLSGVVHQHVNDPQRGNGVELKLAPIPTGSIWLIESALASEQKRATPTPAVGVPAVLPPTASGPVVASLGDGEDLAAAEAELIRALNAEVESLKKLNPFLVLGVGYEASDADVRAAFGELTKRYHPDRFARYESQDLRQVAAEIFILIRDAYRRIGDEGGRSQVLTSLGRTPAPRAVPAPKPANVPPTPPPPVRSTGLQPVVPAPRAVVEPPRSAPVPTVPLANPPAATPPMPTPTVATQPQRSQGIPHVPKAGQPPSVSSTMPVATPAQRKTPPQGMPAVTAPQPTPPVVQSPALPRQATAPMTSAADTDAATVEDLLDNGKYDEALAQYRLLAKKHPNDRGFRAGVELVEGFRALAERDRMEAAQRFEAALEIDPANERAARELADMRRQATNERKGLLSRLMGKKEP
jgi:hypothetical protein